MTDANIELLSRLIKPLVGSDDLVDTWFNSPNKAFDNRCPVDVDYKSVFKYIIGMYGGEYL